MKYKVGQRVRVKSLEWYNKNKDENHEIRFENGVFTTVKAAYLGQIMTIKEIPYPYKNYIFKEDKHETLWTDEMIEGLVEEETKLDIDKVMEEHQKIVDEIFEIQGIEPIEAEEEHIVHCPEGYIFKDQMGNEIHTTKIVLEKANTLKIQSDNMETETHRGYYTTEEETTNESKKVAWFTFGDNDFADKVELALSNRELIQEDGKWFVIKKLWQH